MIEEDDMKRRRTRTDEERKMKDLTDGKEMEREIETGIETEDTGKHWLFSSLKKHHLCTSHSHPRLPRGRGIAGLLTFQFLKPG